MIYYKSVLIFTTQLIFFFSPLQFAEEKKIQLEQMLEAKEKAIRQNKMVIKFREDNIKRLEKAVKTNSLMDEDKMAVIVSG